MEFQERLKSFAKNLGTRKGITLISSFALGLGIIFWVLLQVFKPGMALLYSNLDTTEAGNIVSRLESMNVSYKLTPDGTSIFVPSSQVSRMRLKMAEEGLPSGGSVGYEIFDRPDLTSATSFVQNLQHIRALEGELARTIKSMKPIDNVRVHIVLPKRDLFSEDKQDARAAVMIKTRGMQKLSVNNVQAIQNLVSAAVPSLKSEFVSVMDDRGNLLARGDKDPGSMASAWDETKRSYELRLSKIIESLIEKFVGVGKVRSEVSVDLDLDRLTQQSEKFDSENPVIRSSQSSKSSEKSSESANQDTSTVQNNMPDNEALGGGEGGSSSQQQKQEETVNYEISKVVQTRIKEGGRIKRISVAVLIDGNYAKDKSGNQIYKPRNEEELQKIERLVRGAIGAKENRDTVEVLNMQFVNEDSEIHASKILGLERDEFMNILQLLIVGILGLIGMLILIKSVRKGKDELGAMMHDLEKGEGGKILNSESGEKDNSSGVPGHASSEEEAEPLHARKSSYIRRIEKLIEQESEKAVAMIRFWMNQGGN